MAHIGVARLTVAVARHELATRARWRVEEALRCAGEDGGGRLLLVRRLDLGRLAANAEHAAWNARCETRMRALANTAIHALSPGAEAAGAVYFRSDLEARTALIAHIVHGRRPAGWFWRLAVPVWDGADSWPNTAQPLLADLAARPDGVVALSHLVVRLLNEGAADRFVAAIDGDVVERLSSGSRVPREAGTLAETARIVASRATNALPPAAVHEYRTIMQQMAVPAPVRLWLAEQLVIDAAPHIAASTALVKAAAGLLAERLLAVPARPLDDARDRIPEDGTLQAVRTDAPSRVEVDGIEWCQPGDEDRPLDAAPDEGEAEPATARQREPAPIPDDPVFAWTERRSDAAGLFLLVRPLMRMGLPEWLDRNPALAGEGFAWALLHHIAARHHVAKEDAVWSILPTAPTIPAMLPEMVAWRVGLDRWLRRRTRRRLADIVRRSGWLDGDGTITTARFALASADLALRWQALDVDPGFVPWLGRSVLFFYRDL